MEKRKFRFWVDPDDDGIMVEERTSNNYQEDRRCKYDVFRVFINWKELEKMQKEIKEYRKGQTK